MFFISLAVSIEISGLLFFLSKCVMWGRVNTVGHDVTDFEIYGFHKNTKIKISPGGNIIFPSNKKIH